MTAQTFKGLVPGQSGDNSPVSGQVGQGAGIVYSLYGDFAIPETPEVGDIYVVGWLPYGAQPIGGYMATTDIDTGTETFDMDVGFAGNGVDTADPDYFTNSGLLSGDAIATDFILTNSANFRPFTGPFPTVKKFGAKTRVQAVVNAVAAAGATGSVAIRVDYLMPGNATS